jgi:Conjugative transposon protein TcpC
MFRGPNPGDGARLSDYSHVIPLFGSTVPGSSVLDNEVDLRRPGTPSGRAWSGAGGRWLLWPLRFVLWATLLVIAYRGMTAIIFNHAAAAAADGAESAGTQSAGTGGQFPVTLAEAYASEFGRVYLNFSPANQAQREQALAAFLPPRVAAADPDLGWNGTGQLSLQSEQVAGITVQDPQHAVVTLLATVNGQLMELGVPVIASGGGVVVAGEPAWLPAPQAVAPTAPVSQASDPVARGELLNELPAFFQAYADGDSAALSRFEVRGVSLTGLDGAVAFDSIVGLQVPPGGATRQITVTVIWQLPSQASAGITKLEMAYRMSVVDLQSGKWYVNEISAATEAVEAK